MKAVLQNAIAPGFADPVADAQTTFRAILHALSHPGRLMEIGAGLAAIPPLHPAVTAAALSLFDHETPVWLDNGADTDEIGRYLRFHCGCPLTGDPGRAKFAIVTDPDTAPGLDAFNVGSDEAPESSATVIVQVQRFFPSASGILMSGPGIREPLHLLVDGVPREFWAARQAQNALYPRGVDLLLTAGYHVLGLPRTTRIKV